MKSQFKVIVAMTLVAAVCSWLDPSVALAIRDPYWSTTDQEGTQPPGGDWVPGTGPITPDANGDFWFAITNAYRPQKTKTWTFTFPANVEAVSTTGYYNGGASTSASYILSNNIIGGKRVVKVYYDPQPQWEVIKMHVTSRGEQVELERSDGACKLATRGGSTFSFSSVQHNSIDSYMITELWLFPETATVDEGVPPTLVPPAGSGNWAYQIVTVDPDGVDRPNKGVKWTTDGAGIAEEELFDMTLTMEGTADEDYAYFIKDASGAGEYVGMAVRTETPIPTVSEWGMMVVTLLLLTAGTVVIGRRRRAAAA